MQAYCLGVGYSKATEWNINCLWLIAYSNSLRHLTIWFAMVRVSCYFLTRRCWLKLRSVFSISVFSCTCVTSEAPELSASLPSYGVFYASRLYILSTGNILYHSVYAIKLSAQVQYNYNTTTIKEFSSCITVVLHLCEPLKYNAAMQVFYNLQKTCKLLANAAAAKNLYCSCIALVRTALEKIKMR